MKDSQNLQKSQSAPKKRKSSKPTRIEKKIIEFITQSNEMIDFFQKLVNKKISAIISREELEVIDQQYLYGPLQNFEGQQLITGHLHQSLLELKSISPRKRQPNIDKQLQNMNDLISFILPNCITFAIGRLENLSDDLAKKKFLGPNSYSVRNIEKETRNATLGNNYTYIYIIVRFCKFFFDYSQAEWL